MIAKEKNMMSRPTSKYADRKSSRYDDALDDRKKDSPKNYQGRGDEEKDKLKGLNTKTNIP